MKSFQLTSTICFSVLLTVFSASAPAITLFFDFGDGAASNLSPSPINNVTTAALVLANATDSTGSATGISVAASGFNGGANFNGTTAATGDANIFPSPSTSDNFFGHTLAFPPAPALPFATVTLSGLDATGATSYTFDLFASRLGATDNRTTLYTASGANSAFANLNASGNISNLAVIPGIIPNAAGEIVLDVRAGTANNNGNGFYYLGALRLTTAAVPEPSAAGLLGLALLAPLARRRR